MGPLKTLKGSRIWYSKFGVGKQVGSKVYFHKSVHERIVPQDVWDKAMEMKDDFDGMSNHNNPIQFNTVCYDLRQPNIVRIDECPEFDTSSEPCVGKTYTFDTENNLISIAINQQIFHHKWLWVEPDYKGFDVIKSYEWSKLWLSKLKETASGWEHKWWEQLRKYNVIQGGM